jgi:hypothetical protein
LLTYLDIRNGNNTNITFFNAGGNPNLICIFVDAAAYSEANWFRDPASTFVETEAECDNLGVNDNLLQKPNIYPNPVNNVLYIDLYDLRLTIYELRIIDITGKTVYKSTPNSYQDNNQVPITIGTSINISYLPSGIYFLQLQSKNSPAVLTHKIIKL